MIWLGPPPEMYGRLGGMSGGTDRKGGPRSSSPEAKRRMESQRQRDTKPELLLRAELHRRGKRFRVDRAPLPGIRRRADIVFSRHRVAVFVDGCFWHGCPEHGTWPKANSAWWKNKIEANVTRDRSTDQLLGTKGWISVRVWEHEDVTESADRIISILETST
jgi:DNA mismatch endonuclease, patch repair protein